MLNFLEKAKIKHNNKYNYSLVEYVNSQTKVKIVCPEHDIFEQTPAKHLFGQGCSKCSNNFKKSTLSFIEKAKETHGDKYDYSLTKYNGARNKVKIICPEHGVFEQRAYNHLKGHQCNKCSTITYSNEIFIEKANKLHNNKYDYSLINYKGTKVKIKIICPEHGIFDQQPGMHLFGQGCPKCAIEHKTSSKECILNKFNETHKNEYSYKLMNYINNYTKIKIICTKHGIFEQMPYLHGRGQGCPKCKSSFGERKIINLLNDNNIKYISQFKFNNCKNKNRLPFDFYLEEINLCIEYQGKQHFRAIPYFGGDKTLKYIQNNDKIKNIFCKNKNINIIYINYN